MLCALRRVTSVMLPTSQLPLTHFAELGAKSRDVPFLPKAMWLVARGRAGAGTQATRLQRPCFTPWTWLPRFLPDMIYIGRQNPQAPYSPPLVCSQCHAHLLLFLTSNANLLELSFGNSKTFAPRAGGQDFELSGQTLFTLFPTTSFS